MLFNSLEFIFAFLPITIIVYSFLRVSNRQLSAKLFLAAVSIFFYGWWDVRYVPLVLGSILANYLISLYFSRGGNSAKFALVIGIMFNLSLLIYFKYYNFFMENIGTAIDLKFQFVHIVLPLAISFFTFQQIAYLVEFTQRSKGRRQLVGLQPVRPVFSPSDRGSHHQSQGNAAAVQGSGAWRARSAIRVHRDRHIFTGPGEKGACRQLGVGLCRSRLQCSGCRAGGIDDGRMGRHAGLYLSALLRFLGLFRHGPRPRPPLRHTVAGQFRIALQIDEHHRVLEPVAHLLVPLSAQLSIYSVGRQPARQDTADTSTCSSPCRSAAYGTAPDGTSWAGALCMASI